MSKPKTNPPALTKADGKILTGFSRAAVQAAVGGGESPSLDSRVAALECVGVFVSLKRGSQLRACLGNLNEERLVPLGEVITRAAKSAAINDTRFPRIHPLELAFLNVEVSVMHDLKVIDADGEDRADHVSIGDHGLIISHPKGRGILLPQVAQERGWDSFEFLDQVCLKAGLSRGFWKKSAVVLKTFSGEIFESAVPGGADLEPSKLAEKSKAALIEIVQAGFKKETREFNVTGELLRPQPTPVGILVECKSGENALGLKQGSSLIDLVKEATQSLNRNHPDHGSLSRLVIISHAIALDPRDLSGRLTNAMMGATLARLGDRVSFVLKSGNAIQSCLKQIGVTLRDWQESGAEVTTFQAFEIPAGETLALSTNQQGTFDEPTLSVRKRESAPLLTRGTRLAAVAGSFYPGSSDEIRKDLDNFFFRVSADAMLNNCRAIMLPHAGWKFCGDIIAETVSRAKIPTRILIIGPKHTPHGANWSVSGDSAWKFPNAKIPVDQESVQFLAERVPELEIETEAHLEEHGVEVLLPFLYWSNPRLKIVPVAIGSATLEELKHLSKALAEWRERVTKEDGKPPLFVISSDMNHFENDEETRRRDTMALEKLESGDSAGLYETCLENEISMCGMRPAVAILEVLNAEKAAEVEVVKYGTSARVTGDKNRVVGYAGAILK